MRDINLIRLRYLISVVSQEPILFDCSIKDNITYGLDTPLSMEEIITVARAANIHDFITNLPKVRKNKTTVFTYNKNNSSLIRLRMVYMTKEILRQMSMLGYKYLIKGDLVYKIDKFLKNSR